MERFSNKILIVTGGTVDYQWAKQWLYNRKYDYVIAADSGLKHADVLGLKVDYILGDYDSLEKGIIEKYQGKDVETVTYPPEKDYTDTHLAIITAIKQGADGIDILGATGSRYDHTMTNIYNMKAALDADIPCRIYDGHNCIYLKDYDFAISREEQYGRYVSFIPMTENVVITLEGMKYPLTNYCLKQGLSICQSNEIIEENAKIHIQNGIIVVFETLD